METYCESSRVYYNHYQRLRQDRPTAYWVFKYFRAAKLEAKIILSDKWKRTADDKDMPGAVTLIVLEEPQLSDRHESAI